MVFCGARDKEATPFCHKGSSVFQRGGINANFSESLY
jgi:hypothetical protein